MSQILHNIISKATEMSLPIYNMLGIGGEDSTLTQYASSITISIILFSALLIIVIL